MQIDGNRPRCGSDVLAKAVPALYCDSNESASVEPAMTATMLCTLLEHRS